MKLFDPNNLHSTYIIGVEYSAFTIFPMNITRCLAKGLISFANYVQYFTLSSISEESKSITNSQYFELIIPLNNYITLDCAYVANVYFEVI